MNLDNIRGHIEVMRACKARIAELEEMHDNARAVIEEAMGDDETGKIDGKVALTWKRYKLRKLNQKYLAEHYPDVRETCMETTEYRRMELK